MDYDDFTMDQNTGAYQDNFGFGTIPNSAFHVHGKTDLLNIDTSTLASFANSTCTFEPSTSSTICGPAPGGVVTGKWTELTPPIGSRISGTQQFTAPSFKSISTGTSDSNQALAALTVLGVATPTLPIGNVGTQHNTQITIISK